MNINVRFKGFPTSESLAEYITRRTHQHLSRFGHRISAVDARISDINGPRGGRDKRCQLTVHIPGLPTLQIEELHQSFIASVDAAVLRAARAVARTIERSREHYAPSVEGGTS